MKIRKNKQNNKQFNKQRNEKEESIPIITSSSEQSFDNKLKKDRRLWTRLKPMLVASVSAIAIGIVLGAIMLNLFTSIENEQNVMKSAALQTDDNTNKEGAEDSNTLASIDAMEGYVIQGGVFQEEGNAKAWQKTFKEAGVETLIWKKSNQYYLLAGLDATKENAKDRVAEIKALGLDAFSKQWTTEAVQVELDQVEKEWLLTFQENWSETVETIDGGLEERMDAWDTLLEKDALNSTSYSRLQNETKELLDQIQDKDASVILLKLWKLFDETIKNDTEKE